MMDSIIHAGIAALFLIHFILRSFYIPSPSMVRTLLVNDFIIVNELQYLVAKPQRGEIAVFRSPQPTSPDHIDLIKRVVAVEDDVIAVHDGALYRNGEKVEEPWIWEPIRGEFPEHRVAKGCCFMMGDNRNNSGDSRVFGDVPLENYIGRAELIFYPFSRAGLLH